MAQRVFVVRGLRHRAARGGEHLRRVAVVNDLHIVQAAARVCYQVKSRHGVSGVDVRHRRQHARADGDKAIAAIHLRADNRRRRRRKIAAHQIVGDDCRRRQTQMRQETQHRNAAFNIGDGAMARRDFVDVFAARRKIAAARAQCRRDRVRADELRQRHLQCQRRRQDIFHYH